MPERSAALCRPAAAADTPTRRPALAAPPIEQERATVLVRRAQEGDAEAFGQLYREYCGTVYRYIYYRVPTRALAEDLTSETFARALRGIEAFTWRGVDFGAWLVTIARNLIADHFKSSRQRREVPTETVLDPGEVQASPEESVLAYLSCKDLMAALYRLNPAQRECITLRFLKQRSVAETAAAMGKSEGAIKSLTYRAVQALKEVLDPEIAIAA